jgi:hypothetical protein
MYGTRIATTIVATHSLMGERARKRDNLTRDSIESFFDFHRACYCSSVLVFRFPTHNSYDRTPISSTFFFPLLLLLW